MGYLEDNFSLAGKTVVVTGGGGTLGSSMAKGMAKVGANVILWDVRQEALDEKAAMIAEDCGDANRVCGVAVNLMDEASIATALEDSVAKYGTVDILINGCGGNRGKCALVDQSVEDFEFVLKLNLIAGCLAPTKAFSKYWMAKKAKGCIINIASMSSYIPLSGVWAYDAAKAAVMNQTTAYAKELAPHGIRVNAIAPGFFLADQNRALLINEETGEPTERGKLVLSKTPYGRFGDPDELAGTAIFLSSEAADFVCGVTLPVDGAYLCDSI
jgi:NAD(P)-dependent dehydrogenase (short-subunit alcohol dehydrogenase family)